MRTLAGTLALTLLLAAGVSKSARADPLASCLPRDAAKAPRAQLQFGTLTCVSGVMTATAYGKGVKAACIDGGIRDTKQILKKPFPVYYKYRIPNGSLGRCLITHYQIPVKIGDVVVKPGDIIFADCDGVVCVPRDIAYDVLVRAEEIRENEKKIFGWVAKGETIHEITEKGGYF